MNDGFVGAFMTGFVVPWRGLQLLFSHARLRRLALMPFLLTLAVFVVGLVFGLPLLAQWIPLAVHFSLAALGSGGVSLGAKAAIFLLELLSWPVGLGLLLCLMFIFSRLIASPFYALLAEATLIECGLKSPERFRVGAWVASSSQLLIVALVKAVAFSVVAVLLFCVSFVPGLGLFSAFGFLLLAAFDIVDVSFDALQIGFGQRMAHFREELPAFFGLACSVGLVFLVPGLNFLLLPASVAGASGLIERIQKRTQRYSR